MMVNILFGCIGAVMGAAVLDDPSGALIGLVVGGLAAMVLTQKKRMGILEGRISRLERRLDATATPSPSEAAAAALREPLPSASPPPPSAASKPSPPPAIPGRAPQKRIPTLSIPDGPPAPEERPAPAPEGPLFTPPDASREGAGASASVLDRLKAFLIGGNLVVRAGMIILFFGVAFLLKYAAERAILPLEVRIAAVGAGALGMLGLGWRLRSRRRGYALLLQGGGVGVLYLTLFAAFRLYGLMPPHFTFALMLAVVVLSSLLAVFQDAPALALFGVVGGFLAPVLISTGQGDHVSLFSYYALLNAGILLIAWHKAWRWLNLAGFLFTFSIGALWGVFSYRAADFSSTEPFLILFFLFYLVISVLFAHRQPPHLKGYVDGTLVFGLPIVVFALQARLVRGIPYGLACSALVLSGVYVFLAAALWRRQVTGMRLLTEAFLALGVVFGSVAIPLALDGRWTGAAWALEGAALLWVGVRQNRVLARHFGVMIQIGAGAALVLDLPAGARGLPVLNGVFMAAAAVALAGLFSAWYLTRHDGRLRRWERWFAAPLMGWGLLWWFGTGIREIHLHLSYRDERPGTLLFTGLSVLAMGWTARRLSWQMLSIPAAAMIPVFWLIALVDAADHPRGHLWKRWEALPWLAGFAIHFRVLGWFTAYWRKGVVRGLHFLGALLIIFVATREGAWAVRRMPGIGSVWSFVLWCWIPCLFWEGIRRLIRWRGWPVERFAATYRVGVGGAVMAFVAAWEMVACLTAGAPVPLPYLPVLNPLDISQLFGCFVMALWVWDVGTAADPPMSRHQMQGLWCGIAAVLFLWLNAVVARTVHFWAGVPYTRHALFDSVLFQAAISLLWSVAALGVMGLSARRSVRSGWLAGAGLLALVVAKLFLVDLSGSGTVARIVSFLGVGALMLLIGYVAPLPPREAETAGSDRRGEADAEQEAGE